MLALKGFQFQFIIILSLDNLVNLMWMHRKRLSDHTLHTFVAKETNDWLVLRSGYIRVMCLYVMNRDLISLNIVVKLKEPEW